MADYRRVIHAESGKVLVPQARWCDSFASKLRGFTWRRALAADDGLVLVQGGDSRVNSAIHMLFVFFDLGVIWVNEGGEVVDTALARPWRLHYAPRAPARYVVEAHPDVISQVQIGDRIQFD
jgi:uncharacterized membrane protein (UPF0127 family)